MGLLVGGARSASRPEAALLRRMHSPCTLEPERVGLRSDGRNRICVSAASKLATADSRLFIPVGLTTAG